MVNLIILILLLGGGGYCWGIGGFLLLLGFGSLFRVRVRVKIGMMGLNKRGYFCRMYGARSSQVCLMPQL